MSKYNSNILCYSQNDGLFFYRLLYVCDDFVTYLQGGNSFCIRRNKYLKNQPIINKMTKQKKSKLMRTSLVFPKLPLKMQIIKTGKTFGSIGCDQLQRLLRNVSEDRCCVRRGSNRISSSTNTHNKQEINIQAQVF